MIHHRLSSLLLIATLAALSACQVAVALSADSPTPAPAGPLRDHHFAQIGIQVTDLDRAITFYRDVLGLRLLFTAGGIVFFQVGETHLMVEHGKPGPSTTIYFDDANLDGSRGRLEAHGIKLAGPTQTVQRTATYDLKLAEFSDPDGNPLALMGEVKRKE
jgi:catechol 2,3-dioxygenase-like lactoylglutathione lyase family enzyme